MFVTRKLTVSVGEVVNGGPLPPVPRHTPVCSFNSQSKYIGESLVVEPPTSAQRASADAAGERVASQRRPLGSRSPGLGWVRVCASAQRLAVALRLSPVSQDCVTVLGPPARLTHRGPPWGPCHCARRPAGGDRGEESGAEPDVPPPGLLPQPAPAPAAPPHLPAPAPGAVRGLFPPPGPTPGPPALLPAQQAPMYSDEVRSAARPPRGASCAVCLCLRSRLTKGVVRVLWNVPSQLGRVSVWALACRLSPVSQTRSPRLSEKEQKLGRTCRRVSRTRCSSGGSAALRQAPPVQT